MRLSFRALALSSCEASVVPSLRDRVIGRCAGLVMLGLLVFSIGFLMEGRAVAQSACAQLGVDCSHRNTHGDSPDTRSTESDEDRRARQEAAAEARAERKAEKDRQQAAKRKAQEEARQKKEAAKKEA